MSKAKICIDITNVIPGKGGSGGGIATYAINLIKGLDKTNVINGFDVYVLKHPDFKGFEFLENTKVINVNINNKKLFTRIYWTQMYLPFFCIKHKITVLHRVNPELPIIKVCKYVCTLHDLMFEFYLSHREIKKFLNKKNILKYHLFNSISKHAVRVSDFTIVPTYSIKNELVKNYRLRNEKVIVTHLATQKIKQEQRTIAKKISKGCHIGVIAGFYPHKGHKRVMELAKKFIESGFTDFKISFRGNPAFPNYIKEMIDLKEKLGLNNHIYIVPYEQKASLADIYSEFDIILLLSEYEGFGLPVLEAQAYNLPVFCSDIPVFKEVLEDTAYFIGAENNNGAVNRLIGDLKDLNLLNSLSQRGQVNLNKYSWNKMTAETNDLYNRLIKN